MKTKLFGLSFGALLVAQLLLFGAPQQVHALPPIPSGCPGSPGAQGPNYPDICYDIPAGCPGSPESAFPLPAASSCPYEAAGSSGGSASGSANLKLTSGKYFCGDHSRRVEISINIGCKGKGNPIADMTFAIIRFLSNGVGVVVIASIVWGGIQYSMSRGDPQATAKAIERIRSSLIALLIFIFAYAMLNYVIPAGFFS